MSPHQFQRVVPRQQESAPAHQDATPKPDVADVADAGNALLHLQHTRGNRWVQGMVGRVREAAQPAPIIQTKLVLGAPDDKYEREADRVAQQVAGQPQPESAAQAPTIQRLSSVTGGGGVVGAGPVDAGVQQAIQSARGGGQPLPGSVRAPMEQALGTDFGGVRVHVGTQADALNQSLEARAFTTGSDIFFRRGGYDFDSHSGRELLAHELMHVVQQGNSDGKSTSTGLIQRLIFEGKYPDANKKPVKSAYYNESDFFKKIPYTYLLSGKSSFFFPKIAKGIHADSGAWFLESDVLNICKEAHSGALKNKTVDEIVTEVLADPDKWRQDKNVQPWQRKATASATDVEPWLKTALTMASGSGPDQFYESMQTITNYGSPTSDYKRVYRAIREDRKNDNNRNNRKYIARVARTPTAKRKHTDISTSGDEEFFRIEHTADLFMRDANKDTNYRAYSTVTLPNGKKRKLTWLDLQRHMRVPSDSVYFHKTKKHGLSAHTPTWRPDLADSPQTGGNYDYDQTKDEVVKDTHWNEPQVAVAPMMRRVLQNTPSSTQFLADYNTGFDNREGDLSDDANRTQTAIRVERGRNRFKEIHKAYEAATPKGKKIRANSPPPSPMRTALDDKNNTPLNYTSLDNADLKQLVYDPEWAYKFLHKD